MRRINLLVISIFSVFTMGCGEALTTLAETMLYPFESVNEKYPVPENPPAGLDQHYFEVEATDGSTMVMHSWLYNSGNPTGRTLVYFHGNGTNLQSLYESNFIGVLQDLEYNFVIMDYPGLGRSTGFPNEPNLVNAGIKLAQFAKQKFNRSRIIIWGRSLGAAVATKVAASEQSYVSGLLLVSPWNRFIDVARNKTGLAKKIPKEWLELHGYDSEAAAPGINVPTSIHHGLADKLIPHKFGNKLFEAFPAQTASMLDYEGIGHNDIYSVREYWNNMYGFNPQFSVLKP